MYCKVLKKVLTFAMSMLSCRDECTVSIGKASVDSIEKQERKYERRKCQIANAQGHA